MDEEQVAAGEDQVGPEGPEGEVGGDLLTESAESASGDLLGEGDSPAEQPETEPEAEVAPEEGVPEAYQFNVPDGLEFSEEDQAEVSRVFKELGFTQAQSQAIIDLQSARAIAEVQASQHAMSQLTTGWAKSIIDDPVLGGRNLPASKATVAFALKLFPEGAVFVDEMRRYNMADNPFLFRLLHAVGARIAEDRSIPGGNAAGSPGEPDQFAFYRDSMGG